MMNRPRLVASALALSLTLSPALGTLPASAQLFGPSDEEKAAVKAHEDGQDAAIQQASGRIQQLEDRVRGLTQSLANATGANEELQHQIQQQNQKIDAMQRDFAYRLCTLSAQQLGAADSMNCAAAGTPSAGGGGFAPQPPIQNQAYVAPQSGVRAGEALPPLSGEDAAVSPSGPAPDAPVLRGRGPGTLGTLPVGPSQAANGPVPYSNFNAAPASAARSTDQYDTAMNLMARAQYAEAAAGFRGYADANPDDSDLSPKAIYWVGNMSFVRQDYASAARSFAEVIKKYPKSQRAPDAMLKLAQSVMGMGQKSEGCTTLALITAKKYPAASPQTIASAASLRKTACTK